METIANGRFSAVDVAVAVAVVVAVVGFLRVSITLRNGRMKRRL